MCTSQKTALVAAGLLLSLVTVLPARSQSQASSEAATEFATQASTQASSQGWAESRPIFSWFFPGRNWIHVWPPAQSQPLNAAGWPNNFQYLTSDRNPWPPSYALPFNGAGYPNNYFYNSTNNYVPGAYPASYPTGYPIPAYPAFNPQPGIRNYEWPAPTPKPTPGYGFARVIRHPARTHVRRVSAQRHVQPRKKRPAEAK